MIIVRRGDSQILCVCIEHSTHLLQLPLVPFAMARIIQVIHVFWQQWEHFLFNLEIACNNKSRVDALQQIILVHEVRGVMCANRQTVLEPSEAEAIVLNPDFELRWKELLPVPVCVNNIWASPNGWTKRFRRPRRKRKVFDLQLRINGSAVNNPIGNRCIRKR